MKLKTFAIAALLVVGAASASAQRLTTYERTFLYDPKLDSLALGFGRGGDVFSEPTESALLFAPASFSEAIQASAATLGTLPFTFHDIWKFDGLPAGTYSLDTTINAYTNTTFGLVLFVWQNNGSLDSVEVDIPPDLKSAQGSGTFTVGAGCVDNFCVNLHIYGWDDGDGIPGSGYGNPTNTFSVTVVPEPTTSAMLLAGLGALGWLARRRRS